MKRSLLLIISLLTSCQTDKDAEPLVASVEEFEAEVLGGSGSCGQPMIRFKEKLAEVEQITGTSSLGNTYYAYGLDPDISQESQVVLVRIRKVAAGEQRPCITLGLRYPWLTVVSARVK